MCKATNYYIASVKALQEGHTRRGGAAWHAEAIVARKIAVCNQLATKCKHFVYWLCRSGVRASMPHTPLLILQIGRGDWIRTSDLLNPIQVRYQTALRPGGADRAIL